MSAIRFAYYQVTQVIGLIESLSLIFLVLFIGVLMRFERSGRVVYLGWAVLYYTLIIHTHERYAVLILFLIPMVLTSRSLTILKRALWCAVFTAPLVANLAIRYFLFHIPLLVGTGSATELGFTVPTALQHYAQSVQNVLGINSGPGYFNGLVYPLLPAPYQAASVALLALSLVALGAAFAASAEVRGNWLTSPGPRRNIMLSVVLVLVLILSFTVTIRVEPRWLYAPFLVLLLLFAYSLSLLAQRRSLRAPAVAVLLIFVTLSVALDRQYAENLEGVYFIGARAQAVKILDQTVDRYGATLESRPLYVIDSTESANWQAALSPLVMANSDLGPLKVTTVDSLVDVPVGINALVLVYDIAGGFHEFRYPTRSGVQVTGESYGDGWVGRAILLRGNCRSLTMTIRAFRPGSGRFVSITARGQKTHRYPLSQPEVIVTLTGAQFAGALDATFDRTFVPRDEGVNPDVRPLAALVSVVCVPPTGG